MYHPPDCSLIQVLEDQGTIYPVANIRKVDDKPIHELLATFPNVDGKYVRSDQDQGDVIRLRFVDQNRRIEKQSGFMNPILPEHVKELTHCDAFVFVPITDFEVSLDTLRYLKSNSEGLIIFDAHGPTNTMTVSGDRFLKYWVDRDQWLPYIDVLKMNLEESTCCWFKKEYTLDELAQQEMEGTEHLRPLAEHCLKAGLKSLIVTADARGCYVFHMKDGRVQEDFVHSVKVEEVIDTTGAGDSFAGGLAYGLLKHSEDYPKAARYANAIGAQRTQGKTFDVFLPLAETEQIIKSNYK
jgi:adenosine kinase